MGMFDGIETVTGNDGGQYVLPGQHDFLVRALKEPPDLYNGSCFIAELEV